MPYKFSVGVCVSILLAVWCEDPGSVTHAVRQTVNGYTNSVTGLFTFYYYKTITTILLLC